MLNHAQAVMDAAVQAGAALICENAENQTELCEEAEVEAPLDGLLPNHHSRGRHRRRGKSRRGVGGEEEEHDDEDEEDDESESEGELESPFRVHRNGCANVQGRGGHGGHGVPRAARARAVHHEVAARVADEVHAGPPEEARRVPRGLLRP